MQAVNGTVVKALEADAGSRKAQGRNAGSVKAWEADTESGRMQAAEIGDRMTGDQGQAENPGVHMAACPVVLNG